MPGFYFYEDSMKKTQKAPFGAFWVGKRFLLVKTYPVSYKLLKN
jgi:hypothetical protein